MDNETEQLILEINKMFIENNLAPSNHEKLILQIAIRVLTEGVNARSRALSLFANKTGISWN